MAPASVHAVLGWATPATVREIGLDEFDALCRTTYGPLSSSFDKPHVTCARRSHRHPVEFGDGQVADVIAYLLSEKGHGTTGQVIHLDGLHITSNEAGSQVRTLLPLG